MENKEGIAKEKHIGIYGGTFSPPHIGHEHAARAFLDHGGIDTLAVIPTFVTPLKERKEQTSPEDRLTMCRLAFSFSDRISVSDIEICREGRSYTAETLKALSAPNTRLSFLCGTDMFLTMDKWYMPEQIFKLARVVCMRREDAEENARLLSEKAQLYRERFAAEIDFISIPPLVLSSSEIREKLKNGESAEGLLSPAVLSYIRERGLYV